METLGDVGTSLEGAEPQNSNFPEQIYQCESMNNERPSYRWLDQQGEAFGAPGLEPRWTSSVKDAIGTAYSASSRVWFTCSHGILNEIYHPTIDSAQVRDMGFLITDGETFTHEEKRDLVSTFEYIHPEALGVRYINRDPGGRYTLTKEIICDPHHSVILQHVRLEGHEDLIPRLKIYALLAPHLDGGGAGNTGRALDIAGHKMLLAWKNQWSLAMGASCGFSRVSCGFVGTSDGWHDLRDNHQMDWEFGSATNGNIALFGELNLGAAGTDGAREFTLAFGLGEGNHTALQKTVSALATPFGQHRDRFIVQWHRLANPEWLAAKSSDGGKLMRASHNVLLAHEDKTFSGAFVASASIPWGQAHGDDDLGGYHLVWTRDMVQTATALLACGRAETARRALVYLACTQKPDGGFAQNFWVDGRPYWSGEQLDEVAFPIILAWRLWKANALGEMEIFPVYREGGGISGAACADYASGAMGGERGLFAFDACGGDRRADLRGRYRAGPRCRWRQPCSSRSSPTGSSGIWRLDGNQRWRAASRSEAALHAGPAAGEGRGLRVRKLRH